MKTHILLMDLRGAVYYGIHPRVLPTLLRDAFESVSAKEVFEAVNDHLNGYEKQFIGTSPNFLAASSYVLVHVISQMATELGVGLV